MYNFKCDILYSVINNHPVVLYMCSLQNKCVPYWPTTQGETKDAGRYLVTLLSEKDATDYKVRVIEISAPHRVRKAFLIPVV